VIVGGRPSAGRWAGGMLELGVLLLIHSSSESGLYTSCIIRTDHSDGVQVEGLGRLA
jgi:hypothetical protein